MVAVGSIHPDTGNVYQWMPGLSPDEFDITEMPMRMIKALEGDMEMWSRV